MDVNAVDVVLFDDLSHPTVRRRVSRSEIAKLIRIRDKITVGMFESESSVHHGCAGVQCSITLVFSGGPRQVWTWSSRQLERNSASWAQNERLLYMIRFLEASD